MSEVTFSPAHLTHIFRDVPGHLPDTEANRRSLIGTASNERNYLGTDKWGNDWYAETRPDGAQVWVQVRTGRIVNGGLNQPARAWNPASGLSVATQP